MRKLLLLLILGVISLGGYYTLHALAIPVDDDPVVREARERYLAASQALFETRDLLVTDDIRDELKKSDPMETGLVGIEWSEYTTTSGDLAAKRLSSSSHWVGAWISWYREAGLEAGDRVAIGASGSFPAMILSARIAAEALGLEPVVIASLTSSTWGANVPGFDLWEMERVLVEGGHLVYPARMWSLGGDGDRAFHIDEEDRDRLFLRLAEIESDPATPTILRPVSTSASIDARVALFFPGNGENCRLFVNIGGHAANFGTGLGALSVPSGLTIPRREGSIDWAGDSVILRALGRGVPVIHILDIRGLAASRGIGPSDGSRMEKTALFHGAPSRIAAGLLAAFLFYGLWACFPTPTGKEWHILLKER